MGKLSNNKWNTGHEPADEESRYLRATFARAEPTHAPVSPEQPTYPTPTLGELVSLRESCREGIQYCLENNIPVQETLTDRLHAVNRLIDDRIGLA